MICSDSMHSKFKIRKKYPQVTEKILERLYGHNVSHLERSIWNFRHKHSDYFDVLRFKYESKYKLYNSINLTEFYATTTPVYHRVLHFVIFENLSLQSISEYNNRELIHCRAVLKRRFRKDSIV